MQNSDVSPTNRAEAGFSLLETIIAIAILGIASVPLLTFQSQLVRNSIQLETSAETLTAREVSETYLSLLDLTQEQQGEFEIGGGWTVGWQATAKTAPTRSVLGAGYEGRYTAQVFELTANVTHTNGAGFEIRQFKVQTTEIAPFRSL